jgi:hypothetical protein
LLLLLRQKAEVEALLVTTHGLHLKKRGEPSGWKKRVGKCDKRLARVDACVCILLSCLPVFLSSCLRVLVPSLLLSFGPLPFSAVLCFSTLPFYLVSFLS